MINRIRRLLGQGDSGQAMIMFAILGTALFGMVGLAVVGGHTLVEHRRMQAAADMAALIGAQEVGCTSTDTTCINNAKKYACNYAQNNGYGGGWDSVNNVCKSSGGTTVTVDVPPATCSPYNVDYDNGKTPSSGCVASSETRYDFLEVEIRQDMGTVPIFRVDVAPYVHAVARKGTNSPRDFAIAVLDESLSGALSLGGSGSSGLYVVGSIMSNSTTSTSISHGGNRPAYTCGGRWFTASSSETSPPDSSEYSLSVGSAFFAPSGCNGTNDSPTDWNSGQAPITDPYATSSAPPSSAWTACTPCGSNGHYYHWTSSSGFSGGHWDDGHNGAGYPGSVTGSDRYEYFPGKYPGGITINSGRAYFNPGVYTFGPGSGGSLKITGGNVCTFGAPICDRFSDSNTLGTTIPGTSLYCSTAGMVSSGGTYSSSNVDPATWYYYCSSWGEWDTWLGCTTTGRADGLCTAPKFTVGNTATTTPLNGVTFYGSGSGAGVTISGNGTQSIAFPDPCPGTSTTSWTSGSTQVPFQSTMGVGDSGSKFAKYTYPAGSLPYVESGATSSLNAPTSATGAGNVYPSADLTVDGESACRATLNSGDTSGSIPDVWPGEFQPLSGSGSTGQLLHYLVFLRDPAASVSMAGGGTQLWWGIVYNPGNYPTGACGSSTSGCEISLTGGSGSGGVGPPMLIGQIVGDGVNLGGSASLEVFYRPCDPRKANCQLGPGSTLIQ